MNERACLFGSGLVGVLHDPPRSGALASIPAVLLWNVGMNHRVGPHRIYVDLARSLASKGACVLRFDLSGLGDSELRSGGGSDSERALSDLQDAMHFVQQRTGRDRFIIVGYCSSVDSAHRVAIADPRVVGVVYVEGYAYRNLGFYARYYRRYLNPYRWERYLRNRFGQFFGDTSATPQARESVFVREIPTREQLRMDVATLVRREVKLLFVYAGGVDYAYPGQFQDMYGNAETKGRVDVLFYEQADHAFFRLCDRRRAIEDVVQWIERSFANFSSQSDPRAPARAPALQGAR